MKDRRIIAVIDLGSNSFHMMVARVDSDRITVLDTHKEPVRLRFGLMPDGSISEEAQDRALKCLRRFAQRLRGVKEIRVVGTNTLRRAKTPKPFLKKIEEILNSPVEVIGGSEEARLIYLGVANNLPLSENRNLVIDIGGGSTEFIIGKNKESNMRETRPMGCVGFTMDFFSDGVVTKKRFNKAIFKVSQELESHLQSLSKEHWDVAIGASGTIKAIGNLVNAMRGEDVITMEGLQEIYDRMPWGRPIGPDVFPGLREDREPVFAGGFAILYGIFKTCGITEMQISPHSMREGLFLDYIGRTGDQDVREETVSRLKRFYGVDELQAARIKKTVLELFRQVLGNLFERRKTVRKMLGWAADLHEIGRAVAHTGYHKHGAYIILNGDMDGFSRVEQCLLGFLVLNHRKRLKTDPLPYETRQELPLVFILRLACIFNRERIDVVLPDLAISWRKKQITLKIDRKWLENHPMTRYDLDLEEAWWKRIGYVLDINLEA